MEAENDVIADAGFGQVEVEAASVNRTMADTLNARWLGHRSRLGAADRGHSLAPVRRRLGRQCNAVAAA